MNREQANLIRKNMGLAALPPVMSSMETRKRQERNRRARAEANRQLKAARATRGK